MNSSLEVLGEETAVFDIKDIKPEFGKQMSFQGLSLEAAITAGSFSVCHPYIKWPDFGAVLNPPEVAPLMYISLLSGESLEKLLDLLSGQGMRSVTAAELAEIVVEYPEDIEDGSVIGLGEYIQVATLRGYPCAFVEGGKRHLTLWYHHTSDLPLNPRVALRPI